MRLHNMARLLESLPAALLICVAFQARAQDSAVKTFPTYRAAVSAFMAAIRANDEDAMKQILGVREHELLSSGNATQDENARLRFLERYDRAHALVREAPDKVILTVGPSAWPVPFPIVRADGAWHFDASEGAQEIAYRRIGHNELDAIRVCRALYTAQKQYAANSHDGVPAGTYAQRFRSEPGAQNGLYWEVKEGESQSPTGSLLAEATSEGYDSTKKSGKPTPFHGYLYRILKAQGPHASGGAKDYVLDGRMTGGFAFVAYPAEYRSSGVMTFLVGPRGVVYQKDLGETTEEVAKGIAAFDPDSTWTVAR
ncbi:MAG: DUF2950 domain-containing protein [Steroidobacteraceae bacterium]